MTREELAAQLDGRYVHWELGTAEVKYSRNDLYNYTGSASLGRDNKSIKFYPVNGLRLSNGVWVSEHITALRFADEDGSNDDWSSSVDLTA